MPEIKDVSGTAFVVAEFRAEENRERAPLYQRSGRRTVSERGQPAGGCTSGRALPARQGNGQGADELARRHAREAHPLALPAGGDPRRRSGYARGQETGGWRGLLRDRRSGDAAVEAGVLRAGGIEVDVTFIPGNYVTDGLIDLLARNGFDFDPADVLHLGREHDVLAARQREGHPHRAQDSRQAIPAVVRLHGRKPVVTNTTGDSGITTLVESFASMGAPWLSGIRDIQRLRARSAPEPHRGLQDRRAPSHLLARPPGRVANLHLLFGLHGRRRAAFERTFITVALCGCVRVAARHDAMACAEPATQKEMP
mgnify:CR=1 FL=1